MQADTGSDYPLYRWLNVVMCDDRHYEELPDLGTNDYAMVRLNGYISRLVDKGIPYRVKGSKVFWTEDGHRCFAELGF